MLLLHVLPAEVVQMYLQKNAALAMTVNKTDGSTAVSAACQVGQDSILQLLLATLRVSALSNTFDPSKRLLDHADSNGMIALATAAAASPCSAGHLACAQALLQAGCSLLPQDQAGRSCLHHAAVAGNSQMMQLLLEAAEQQEQQQQHSEQESLAGAAALTRR
jgi:ankyrin repeat protein